MTQTKREKHINGLVTNTMNGLVTNTMNGLVTNTMILKILALKKEFAQNKFPKKVDRKYRQVIRCLHNLRDKDLIRLNRTEQLTTGGKPRNFWAITFYGLINVLKYLDTKETNSAAQLHGDKWLIFSEWSYLLKKLGKYNFMLFKLVKQVSSNFNSLRAKMIPAFTNSEIKQMGYTQERWKKREALENLALENIRQKCTDTVLGLDILNDKSRLRFILKEYEEVWLKAESETLAIYAQNPVLKEYIRNRFEQEANERSLVEALRGQWEQLVAKK